MIFLDANFLIYLNLGVKEVEEAYLKLLREESLALDPLVLDEVIYVSRRKYDVEFKDTIEFLDEIVLRNSVLLPITSNEYERAKDLMIRYSLKPSDAFHVAVMLNNSIKKILSEDKDFEKVKEIEKVWV
ncbi:type II toxin-antitoxin system VapC family toxin [Metallosphaera hakonensis]|uniref:PIN domain-containing protein n=1 Tax=Metallosphaera hakonensis JCM 8857 = DSM 7519 TaxID=1293036 RepID=A0A2U9IV63_9CREN|nr:type II toxin-antitoxin system VapC family toxin [Metallosphaera hakonensis]AWR99842.1 PIN domain-containing protein [Metallosphaera hakonensis JCM 8857 = DSM 7519]